MNRKDPKAWAALYFIISCLLASQMISARLDYTSPVGRAIILRSKGADINTWMDTQQRPCDNFYKYACSNWERINSAELSNVYSQDKLHSMAAGLQGRVRKLLKGKIATNRPEVRKVHDFYESCRYVRSHMEAYVQSLRKIYCGYGAFSFEKEKVECHETTPMNWWSLIGRIQANFAKSIILSVVVLPDVKNKNHSMVYISPPDFQLLRYDDGHSLPAALQRIFGLDELQAKQKADDILGFEFMLVQGPVDVSSGASMDEMLTLYNTADFIEKYKSLMDVKEYLQLTLNTTQLPEQISVYDEGYLQHLLSEMSGSGSGSEQLQQQCQDYILWLLLEEYLLNASPPEWDKWCAEKTKKYFGKFIDHTLYMTYRSPAYEQEILQLWEDLKASFRDMLEHDTYPWLGQATRQEALAKLQNMRLNINSYEKEDFAKFFQALTIANDSYVLNIHSILRGHVQTHPLQGANHTTANGIDEEQVLSFTPVYNTYENHVSLPVALLQPAYLWLPIYPKAVKFATLGFLLAHEMLHGFDDDGRQYDAHGQVREWWDPASVQAFNEQRLCFQQQYSSFIYPGDSFKVGAMQAENIADNGGIRLAYNAYSEWLRHSGQAANESFVNVSLSNEELFFVSYAQLWCEDVHWAYQEQLAASDDHAPAMYRVIGPLANFQKFSDTFKCPMGTNMNPYEKCQIY